MRAGKHLFCEKPLALSLAEGEMLAGLARERGLRLTIDYVMRRSSLWEAAARIRASGALGTLLHMDLANHAAGLNLPAAHWFWDAAQSGGIWIEHGVHFFDAFAWVAGASGQIASAQAFTNAAGQRDRVAALAQFGDAAAHFYHGFTHSSATEQTTVRLAFARGYVTLHGWVPTEMDITAGPQERAAVQPLLPSQVSEQDGMLRAALPEGKSAAYTACIQAGMRELARAVRDASAPLAVTAEHGLASLRLAADATRLSIHARHP
jgi:predicted dehydrogenase